MKEGQEEKDGKVYGCHIDLFDGQEPDGCVKDYGCDDYCIYASRCESKWDCKYWRPVGKAVEDQG